MSETRIPGFCALCRSRCGAIAVVENDRLVRLEPDPSHPTGVALCVKGRATPEIEGNPNRLLYPMKRTAPKGAADPGFVRISWDEALDRSAAALRAIAAAHGPEAVAFAVSSPSATPISDGLDFIERFINRFGSPNICNATELCNWHKDHGHRYTFGRGIGTPDFARAETIVLWGHNPSTAWLDHATAVAEAKARGATLIVVDPRRAGFAARADAWLRVRPGTDAALALGLLRETLRRGAFDEAFLRRWTNAPLLVRRDTGRFLRAQELAPDMPAGWLVGWNAKTSSPLFYDPQRACYLGGELPALDAAPAISPASGAAASGAAASAAIACATAFALLRERAEPWTPAETARITGVPAAEIERAAALIAARRPCAYYCWTGIGQHANATQTDRAIAILMALTGSFDAPGGNVDFGQPPMAPVNGADFLGAAQRAKMIGRDEHPLGPARFGGGVTSALLYRAILEGKPYPVRGLMSFGANLLVTRGDGERGRRALQALDFYVHADPVLNRTAREADIVLPVNTQWEREALRAGFEISEAAASLIQLRKRAVPPAGESRSDTEIAFALAERLGFGADFWHGDIDAALAHRLAPSGVSLAELRARPEGIAAARQFGYRRHEQPQGDGFRGVDTPTRLVELYSEQFRDAGYDPLPHHAPTPAAAGYPLTLTMAKLPHYCHSQHRDVPSLRRRVPDPVVDLHPEAARARGIGEGDWVVVSTARGAVRLKARLDPHLAPDVACAQYGWAEANANALVGGAPDPISGSVTHHGFPCEISPAEAP
ncbi:MAG: molybdopterin-dependent oxidoreductase [Rhodospirillaceae bacterium]|nr:molybdopterin-dependent oxidoreductase [Rhodospirillaceae bacterium]